MLSVQDSQSEAARKGNCSRVIICDGGERGAAVFDGAAVVLSVL